MLNFEIAKEKLNKVIIKTSVFLLSSKSIDKQNTSPTTILQYRRKRYDIIQVFKIVHKIDDIDMNKFFTFTDNSQLRGHNLKLTKPRVNKSIRLNSFPMQNIQVWNNLPSEVVNSKTVLEFKTKIDHLWKSSRYELSDIY